MKVRDGLLIFTEFDSPIQFSFVHSLENVGPFPHYSMKWPKEKNGYSLFEEIKFIHYSLC